MSDDFFKEAVKLIDQMETLCGKPIYNSSIVFLLQEALKEARSEGIMKGIKAASDKP